MKRRRIIAVAGGFGTLTEIGFSLNFKVPVVGLKSWKLDHMDSSRKDPFPNANTPQEAFDLLLQLLQK